MKAILLIGLGRFGRHIALKLNELNHQVMAVDKDEARVNEVLPYVTNAQIGDSTNEDFLASLGRLNFCCATAPTRWFIRKSRWRSGPPSATAQTISLTTLLWETTTRFLKYPSRRAGSEKPLGSWMYESAITSIFWRLSRMVNFL